VSGTCYLRAQSRPIDLWGLTRSQGPSIQTRMHHRRRCHWARNVEGSTLRETLRIIGVTDVGHIRGERRSRRNIVCPQNFVFFFSPFSDILNQVQYPAPPSGNLPLTPLYDSLCTNTPLPVMTFPKFHKELQRQATLHRIIFSQLILRLTICQRPHGNPIGYNHETPHHHGPNNFLH